MAPSFADAEALFKKLAGDDGHISKHELVARHGNVDYGLFDKLDKSKDGKVDIKEW